jgi:hypothetical protein
VVSGGLPRTLSVVRLWADMIIAVFFAFVFVMGFIITAIVKS